MRKALRKTVIDRRPADTAQQSSCRIALTVRQQQSSKDTAASSSGKRSESLIERDPGFTEIVTATREAKRFPATHRRSNKLSQDRAQILSLSSDRLRSVQTRSDPRFWSLFGNQAGGPRFAAAAQQLYLSQPSRGSPLSLSMVHRGFPWVRIKPWSV